ncbi:MAG: hypothetical protein M1830_004504 [Pleopsidium flavum]|nr:MAG: hypothetical protein M1830_004504 [Pleopsidium flavum]
MRFSLLIVLSFITVVRSAVLNKRVNATDPWFLERFSSLITFGDSYTDENRLNYFVSNHGSAPPPGTLLPESFMTPGGGRTWPRYVVQYTGSEVNNQFVPQLNLYDYAVSGAVCSNLITPRFFPSINADFPSVLEYEIPAYMNDSKAVSNTTGKAYFTPALTQSNAVYAIWIGTNDLGVNLFLTDSQAAGKTITSFTDCIFVALDQLYASGGRYFVLNNIAPLYLAPLYANDTDMGVGHNQYWKMKPDNHTAIAEKMKEYSTTINNVWKYQVPYEALIANRYPGANFAMFDVYSLILDIYTKPSSYLNGTAPANVTGFSHQCSVNGTMCTMDSSPDSFLWFDELHPSEQTDRIIARNFVDVINGNSSYATYY